MSEQLRLSQLVCSRLCHDLVGAAGAVNAGLEILAEMGGLDDSAMELATKSGQELTRRLGFFRVAFGAGGAGKGGAEVTALRALAQDFLEGSNSRLEWPDYGDGVREIDPVMGKLLLNLILIGSECLPRGGTVSVQIAEVEGGIGLAVSATGSDAGLREDLAQGLTPGKSMTSLDSRSIHSYLTQLLVLEAGCELEVAADHDEVRFAALAIAD
ncbi:histidine phosphotransferase family protein [Thalassospiraceae bacterium LMO-JJ14]|nr:histidine phosphotransferase family protein [Thalassospiraceae bacterium LMO-JJ14]